MLQENHYMNIKFFYLDFPFWRAEIGRLALYLGEIDFEDIRVTREEFQRIKEIGQLDDGTKVPFHQLPCININGLSICQTGGISRFCGKIAGLYPKDNLIEAASIDQIIDLATDITVLLGPYSMKENDTRKKSMREALVSGLLLRKISYLEKLLDQER